MSEADEARQEAVEQRKRDRDMTQAQLADEDDRNVELLRELTETELHPGQVQVLTNYLSKDLLLSKQDRDELNEFKYQFQVRVLRALWMHPHPESGMQGDARAVHYDDAGDHLQTLDSHWRNVLRNFADATYRGRIRRSESGFQQKEMSKTHSVVERASSEANSDDDRLGGLW